MTRGPGEDLRDPDYIGPIGRAWDVPVRAEDMVRREQSAVLGAWLVEAPFVHPAWDYHSASLVHLRDILGGEPLIINRPGATHEFVMYALDPRFDDYYDPNDIDSLRHPMTPPDVVDQLI